MKNLIPLWSNLFRLLEIAKLGNFTVSVYAHKDYLERYDDYETLKEFCSGWFDKFSENGDLKIELVKPNSFRRTDEGETKKDISGRVEEAKKYTKPDNTLDDGSSTLLDNAVNRLDLSLKQYKNIRKTAKVIAQLDHREDVRAEHIAEAIQYSYLYDATCNLESKDLLFGKNIKIKQTEIEQDDVIAAVKYLTDLILPPLKNA